MYTGKYPRWFTDNALGLRPRALSETTSRIFPVYTGYLGYNLYIYNYNIIYNPGHWDDGEFAAVNRVWADTIFGSYIHGAAAVESIAMDGQSIGSKVAAAVTHNSVTIGTW